MRKLSLILTFVLCICVAFGSFSASADTIAGNVLTLEKAKEIALKNDIQYNLQDTYLKDALVDYEDARDDSSASTSAKSDLAAKSSAQVSDKAEILNLYNAYEKAILEKRDIQRASDYEVTDYYYQLIESKNSLAEAKTTMELSKKNLDTAKVKFDLGLITKSSLGQSEQDYASSKTTFNNTTNAYEEAIAKLEASIGQELDTTSLKLDEAITLPSIATLTVDDTYKDYLNNNLTYYSSTKSYELLKYKLDLLQEKYDDYKSDRKLSSDEEENFDDLIYEARKNYDDAKTDYRDTIEDLDQSIRVKYDSLASLYSTYEDEAAELADAVKTAADNKVKLELGLITSLEYKNSIIDQLKAEHAVFSTKADIIRTYTELTQYSYSDQE